MGACAPPRGLAPTVKLRVLYRRSAKQNAGQYYLSGLPFTDHTVHIISPLLHCLSYGSIQLALLEYRLPKISHSLRHKNLLYMPKKHHDGEDSLESLNRDSAVVLTCVQSIALLYKKLANKSSLP